MQTLRLPVRLTEEEPSPSDYVAIGYGSKIVGFGKTQSAARSRAVANGQPNAVIVHGSLLPREVFQCQP